MLSVHRFLGSPVLLSLALLSAGPATCPIPARAGIPPDGTYVLGFHLRPVSESSTLPFPKTPDQLVSRASEPGLYDAWLFLFSRAPLVGAWSLSVSLVYDGAPGSGADILDWQSMMDEFYPQPGWPAAGVGMFGRWDRFRCLEHDDYMLKGEAGWWLQIAGRATIRAHGPDTITFGDPEPGVVPQLVECFDEQHDLDGTDSWSRVVPAVFGSGSGPDAARRTPETAVRGATWGGIKARHGDGASGGPVRIEPAVPDGRSQ